MLAVSPEAFGWTFWQCRNGAERASRCDLIIANGAALPLIESLTIAVGARDAGHAPVVARLRAAATSVDWCPGRPLLPELLRRPRKELEADVGGDWASQQPMCRKTTGHNNP
eukprot:TRINITY_DN4321_c0_g1_i1.p1 TRINITY_DN4321_c0_g1~~TRINITY_DN4321_c0_g1_i1.p1  ORF type:complete len:112 (-),score=24.12 TRINITY_DN4321_c0_g1_i1:2-337(-)